MNIDFFFKRKKDKTYVDCYQNPLNLHDLHYCYCVLDYSHLHIHRHHHHRNCRYHVMDLVVPNCRLLAVAVLRNCFVVVIDSLVHYSSSVVELKNLVHHHHHRCHLLLLLLNFHCCYCRRIRNLSTNTNKCD